jgi:hypothetical protein
MAMIFKRNIFAKKVKKISKKCVQTLDKGFTDLVL